MTSSEFSQSPEIVQSYIELKVGEKDRDGTPWPTLHYLDVWVEDEAGTVSMRNDVLPYEDVDDWLDLEGEYAIASISEKEDPKKRIPLRLAYCDFKTHPYALGCTQPIFEKIQRAFDLHETSEEVILASNGAFARYLRTAPNAKRHKTMSLVLKMVNYRQIGHDALTLTCDLETRSTRAFLHGIPSDRYFNLLRSIEGPKKSSYFEHPLLLPVKLLQHHRERAEAWKKTVDYSLLQTEIEIGYAIPGMRYGFPPIHSPQNWKQENIDFESITKRLYSCQTELCAVNLVGGFGKEAGMFLSQLAQELNYRFKDRQEVDFVIFKESLLHRIDLTTNLYMTMVSQITTVLKERVQSHINLTFSLIAQDENRISRAVAEESASIAVASKRDSTAMKTIALMTIIFLPPTFVATFFSMTMFDWTPEPPKTDIVSKHFWVYWAVAVPLTVLVLILWRVWWAMEEKRYHSGFGTSKEKNKRSLAERFQSSMNSYI